MGLLRQVTDVLPIEPYQVSPAMRRVALPQLVAFLEHATSLPVEQRPAVELWAQDFVFFARDFSAWYVTASNRGAVTEKDLTALIQNQAEHRYQSFLESVCNAIDAMAGGHSDIGRFGVGVFQIFRELENFGDRITIESQTQRGTGLRLDFEKDRSGEILVSWQTVNKTSPGVTLRLQKSLTTAAQTEISGFLEHKLKLNRRVALRLNTVSMNPLNDWKSVEGEQPVYGESHGQVDISINAAGFTVTDSGTGMDPETLFGVFLLPGVSSKFRSLARDTRVFYRPQPGQTSASPACVRLQVSGVEIKTIAIPADAFEMPFLAAEVVLELGEHTWLPESRNEVAVDAAFKRSFEQALDQVLAALADSAHDSQRVAELMGVINSLWQVALALQKKNKSTLRSDDLTYVMLQKLRPVFEMLERKGYVFAPASEGFSNLSADGTKTILFYSPVVALDGSALYLLKPAALPGARQLAAETGTHHEAWMVDTSDESPSVFMSGDKVFIARWAYERNADDLTMINLQINPLGGTGNEQPLRLWLTGGEKSIEKKGEPVEWSHHLPVQRSGAVSDLVIWNQEQVQNAHDVVADALGVVGIKVSEVNQHYLEALTLMTLFDQSHGVDAPLEAWVAVSKALQALAARLKALQDAGLPVPELAATMHWLRSHEFNFEKVHEDNDLSLDAFTFIHKSRGYLVGTFMAQVFFISRYKEDYFSGRELKKMVKGVRFGCGYLNALPIPEAQDDGSLDFSTVHKELNDFVEQHAWLRGPYAFDQSECLVRNILRGYKQPQNYLLAAFFEVETLQRLYPETCLVLRALLADKPMEYIQDFFVLPSILQQVPADKLDEEALNRLLQRWARLYAGSKRHGDELARRFTCKGIFTDWKRFHDAVQSFQNSPNPVEQAYGNAMAERLRYTTDVVASLQLELPQGLYPMLYGQPFPPELRWVEFLLADKVNILPVRQLSADLAPGTREDAWLSTAVHARVVSDMGGSFPLALFTLIEREEREQLGVGLSLSMFSRLAGLYRGRPLTRVEAQLREVIAGQDQAENLFLREVAAQNPRDYFRSHQIPREQRRVDVRHEICESIARGVVTDTWSVVTVENSGRVSLGDLVRYLFPLDASSKRGRVLNPELLTGMFGRGFYTVFADFDRVRVTAGDGRGRVWEVDIEKHVDGRIWVRDLRERHEKFSGLRVERFKRVDPAQVWQAHMEGVFIKEDLYLYASAIHDMDIYYNDNERINESLVNIDPQPMAGEPQVQWRVFHSPWRRCRVTQDRLYVCDLDANFNAAVPDWLKKYVDDWGLVIDLPRTLPLTRTRNAQAGLTEADRADLRQHVFHLYLRAAIHCFLETGTLPGGPKDFLYSANIGIDDNAMDLLFGMSLPDLHEQYVVAMQAGDTELLIRIEAVLISAGVLLAAERVQHYQADPRVLFQLLSHVKIMFNERLLSMDDVRRACLERRDIPELGLLLRDTVTALQPMVLGRHERDIHEIRDDFSGRSAAIDFAARFLSGAYTDKPISPDQVLFYSGYEGVSMYMVADQELLMNINSEGTRDFLGTFSEPDDEISLLSSTSSFARGCQVLVHEGAHRMQDDQYVHDETPGAEGTQIALEYQARERLIRAGVSPLALLRQSLVNNPG